MYLARYMFYAIYTLFTYIFIYNKNMHIKCINTKYINYIGYIIVYSNIIQIFLSLFFQPGFWQKESVSGWETVKIKLY